MSEEQLEVSVDLTDVEPDHAHRQELLPEAVEQAAQFAARMRQSIAVRSGATDSMPRKLVQRMRPNVDVAFR